MRFIRMEDEQGFQTGVPRCSCCRAGWPGGGCLAARPAAIHGKVDGKEQPAGVPVVGWQAPICLSITSLAGTDTFQEQNQGMAKRTNATETSSIQPAPARRRTSGVKTTKKATPMAIEEAGTRGSRPRSTALEPEPSHDAIATAPTPSISDAARPTARTWTTGWKPSDSFAVPATISAAGRHRL